MQNRAARSHYPRQKQENVDKFISAAPGLPVHLCGGGIMPECVNMEPREGRLELRLPMQNLIAVLPSHAIDGANQRGSLDSLKITSAPGLAEMNSIISVSLRFEGGERREDCLMFMNGAGEAWLLFGNCKVSIPDEVFASSPLWHDGYGSARAIPFCGDMSIINAFGSKGGFACAMLESSYSVTKASDLRLRKLGLPALDVSISGWGRLRYGGVQFVRKNADGVIIQASGIKRNESPLRLGLLFARFPDDFDYRSITHVQFWLSDSVEPYDESGAYNLGNPDEMHLVHEFDMARYEELEELTYQGEYMDFKLPKEKPADADDDYKQWKFRLYTPPKPNKGVGFKIYNPPGTEEFSMLLEDFEFDKDNYNLVPMENALCFAGNRLWGALDSRIICSNEAGQPTQEQRKPAADVECGVGEIRDICEMNGDIYVFGTEGVAKILGGDIESKPRLISNKASADIKISAVPSFGIFAKVDDSLLFLDAETLAYGTDCKGIDLNAFLGELALYITHFELFCGNLYFITAGRLFKMNIMERLGISEIKYMSLTPKCLANIGNGSLAILLAGGPDGSLSIGAIMTKGYFDGISDAKLESCEPTDWIDYRFMAATSAMSGWVEHSDTHLCAWLPEWAAAAAQDVCDNRAYPRGADIPGKSADGSPRDYILVPGASGRQRPIGKAIGLRVHISLPRMGKQQLRDWVRNRAPSIYGAKFTTIRQEEVLNPLFDPNKIAAGNTLSTESDMILLMEE